MAEGRSYDYFSPKELGEKYPEYDNMSLDELNQKYDLLKKRESIILSEFSNDNYCNKTELAHIKNRGIYIDSIRMRKFNQMETSSTENDDGKTVTITNKKVLKLLCHLSSLIIKKKIMMIFTMY